MQIIYRALLVQTPHTTTGQHASILYHSSGERDFCPSCFPSLLEMSQWISVMSYLETEMILCDS